jgi:2-C-methyl-D-erythritol 4-phosphate cytidylyltransferase
MTTRPTSIPRGHAIILAAGQGRRFGAGTSKGLVPVHGRPLLAWSLDTFARHRSIGEIVVVLPPGTPREKILKEILRPMELDERVVLVGGGARRQDSSLHGIEALPEKLQRDARTIVLIHDAARPLVSSFLITRCLRAIAENADAAGIIPALPVRETLKKVDDSRVVGTVARDGLMASQTPQVFRLGPLRAAHERAAARKLDASDDAVLLEAAGHRLFVVPGDLENLKVTYPEDRLLAERLLRERERR